MSDTKLKIGPLPDQTPVKRSITLARDLDADLEEYARIYRGTYGQDAKVTDLIPTMLQAFLASDTGFRRARKRLSQQG